MSIQDLLIAWGRGRAMNDPPNGLPNQTTFARFISLGSISVPPLDPDYQGRIDAVVSRMKHSKPQHHKIIFCAYVNNLRDGAISKEMRFDGQRYSRSWVRQTRKAAESYLEAKLDV